MTRVPRGVRPQAARHAGESALSRAIAAPVESDARTGRESPARTPARPIVLAPGTPLRADVAAGVPISAEALEAARIHVDDAAGMLTGAAGATAMTVGRDIYFSPGAYQPGSRSGDAMLAHELVHVAQYVRGDTAGRSGEVVPGADALEREARAVESSVSGQPTSTQATVPVPSAEVPAMDAPMLRQPCVDANPLATLLLAADWDPETEIDLQGRQFMPDLPEFCAYLVIHGPSLLKVRFGNFAHGHVALHYGWYDDHHGLFTNWMSEIFMTHPALPDVPNQRMAIVVEDDEIFGSVGSVGDAGGVAMDTQISLTEWAMEFGPKLLELPDYRDVAIPSRIVNGIDRDGKLGFTALDYTFNLPGPGDSRHAGRASLTLDDATGTVTANATIRAPGLGDGALTLNRLPGGSFTGTATMTVGPFGDQRGGHAGFSGSLRVTYGRRVLDVMGTVRYDGARISGTGTLRLTDAVTAWNSVRPHILAAVGMLPPTMEPSTGMALVGWGTMEFRFGDWLRGRASVVVAPDGHIYSRGEIRPTGNIRFLDPPRVWNRNRPIVGPFEASVPVFEALAVSIEAGGRVSLWGSSTLGPAQIHRLHLIGAFSTNTAVPWQLEIGGTLSLYASATLELRASVFLRGTAVHLVDVAEVSGDIFGDATVNAQAEATVRIGRRPGTSGEGSEYFIRGTLGAYALVAAGLRGEINFSVFGAGFNVWRSNRYQWSLGNIGLEKSFDYTLGSSTNRLGNVSVEAPDIKGGASNLISGIAHRNLSRDARGAKHARTTGRWNDAGTGTVEPFDAGERMPAAPAAVPDLPNMDPVTTTPGGGGSPNAGAGGSGAGGSGAGGADAGTGGQEGSDAGTTPDAATLGSHGVPLPPPPQDIFPSLPQRTPAPFTDDELTVSFTMLGNPHRLRLIPTQPKPRLVMQSAPDDLVDKLDSEIAEQTRASDFDEVAALETIKTEAQQVVDSADELGLGDVANVDVAELQPLADRLQTFGDQFEEGDLNDDMPAAMEAPYDPVQPEPTTNVLELPWPDFVAQVEATSNPVDALVLIERQRQFLDREYSDVQQWLNSHQRWDTGYSEATRRRTSLVDKIRWCIQRERALRTAVNPNARVALPCFPAGTPVHTPSGPRAIESLSVGDDVWSADPETGTVIASQVEGITISQAIDLFTLRAGESELVSATGNHPIWNDDARAWTPAAKLLPGVAIRTRTSTVRVTSIERRTIAAAPTFNLVLGPLPTFFVGSGVLVHNGAYALWHTFPWAAQHNFKIYVGLNDADEFRQYVYVGQTKQTVAARERRHHLEAEENLRDHRSTMDADELFFWRFKQGMRLTELCNGLKGEAENHSNQARYLEQKNIDAERAERGIDYVLNRIDASSDMVTLADRILNDPDCDVRAAGYCLTPP